jgi:hypothetical protein
MSVIGIIPKRDNSSAGFAIHFIYLISSCIKNFVVTLHVNLILMMSVISFYIVNQSKFTYITIESFWLNTFKIYFFTDIWGVFNSTPSDLQRLYPALQNH